jgi:hypothetical protein
MKTSIPRSSAVVAYSKILCGFRWAEITCTSYSIPNFSNAIRHFLTMSKSESLPIITATFGVLIFISFGVYFLNFLIIFL